MFTIFSQIWVMAFFLHYSEDVRPLALVFLGIIGTVVMLMSRNKAYPFVGFVGLFTLVNLYNMPFIANHSNFYTAVSMLLLFWLGWQFVCHKNLDEDRLNKEFASFRGGLCLSLFVVYLMAGIHKLNWDFFDPEVSCAADFFFRYADEYGFNPEWIPQVLVSNAAPLVAAVEVLGALLLILPRMQLLGVLWFVGLHSYLAPLSFYDFASICYSILFLFLPATLLQSSSNKRRLQQALGVWITLMLVGAVAAGAMLDYEVEFVRQDVMQGWPFLVGSFYFIWVLMRLMRESGEGLFTRNAVNLWRAVPRWGYALPLILLFYTNTSYLGLRTAGNTTMFSNLRTEGGHGNHMFIPDWMQIFDFQKSLYQILEVPPEQAFWYRGMPSEGGIMTEFELGRMVGEWRDKGLVVPMKILKINEREARSYDDITQSSEWKERQPGWLLRKTMLFRQIQPFHEQNRCRW